MKLADVKFNDNGNIIDALSGKVLKDTPEERVRQRFINILQSDYGYPRSVIAREVPIQQGSKILKSDDGAEIRADIVVYTSKKHVSKETKEIYCLLWSVKSQMQLKDTHN